MSGVDDLVAFVRRCLDEDEQVARSAAAKFGFDEEPGSGRWNANDPGYGGGAVEDEANDGIVVYDEGAPTEEQSEHIARWDPARVLAEVQAKRERLLWIEGELADDDTQETVQWLAKLEAQPHAGQDGWREEWRA